MAIVINFDGIVGPSHNYAGLSLGNLAATAHAGDVSYPKAAALQGLDKMRGNLALGLAQGFLVPLPRPNTAWLEQIAANDPEPDFTALDRLLPHPVYGQQHWISILNPSDDTFRDTVVPLLALAHDRLAAVRARHHVTNG